jgi:hypothetical protein
MTLKEKAQAYDAQQLVDRFNQLYQTGSTVLHRTIAITSMPFQKHTVKSPAFIANKYNAVVFFNEISGYCSIDSDFIQYE